MAYRWLIVLLDALLALILILILMVNPPEEGEDKAPGQIIVEISWPDHCRTDVDLWVKAPGDNPVGYSNLRGKIFNLLRDDLGSLNDPSDHNYENAYSRGAPDGEYIFNIHLFNHRGGDDCPLPIEVYYRIAKKDEEGDSYTITSGQRKLEKVRQEITLMRFTLHSGKVSDMHDVPIKLRSNPKFGG